MNLMLMASAMFILTVTPAFACKVQYGIGGSNKRILNIQQRLAKGQKINVKQRALYAEYQKDSKAYEAAFKRGWPVCSETGGTSCFPNCAEVSAKELAAAEYEREGIRYRVSEDEAHRIEDKKLFLKEKWKR